MEQNRIKVNNILQNYKDRDRKALYEFYFVVRDVKQWAKQYKGNTDNSILPKVLKEAREFKLRQAELKIDRKSYEVAMQYLSNILDDNEIISNEILNDALSFIYNVEDIRDCALTELKSEFNLIKQL